MSDLKHKAQRLDSDVRLIPFLDQTDLLVVLITGVVAFMIAGRLIANFGLRIVIVAAACFAAYKLSAVLKRLLAPYPKAVSHALSWSLTSDVLSVEPDAQPVPLYSGRPPLPD